MTVETGVFTILSTSADLAAAAGVAPDALPALIYRTGVIDPPDKFITIRWEEPTMFGNLGTPGFTLRVHDRDRTYAWIDKVLEAAKAVLTAVVHQQGITQVDWRGRSPDLIDDGYGTLTKYDTFVALAGLNAGRI